MMQLAAAPRKPAILILFLSLLIFPRAFAQTAAFGVVITHGRIIDGTGSPWYSGDIGIRGEKSRPLAGSPTPLALARLTHAAKWLPRASSTCSVSPS
jgi:hypothetical protein